MSQLHTWPVVVAVVFTLAAACGGKSNEQKPAVGAAGAATGVTAGSGQGATGQAASGAGGASTDGQAGSTSASGTDGDPIKCDPASAASCADGELIQCDASGSLKRTDCGAYAKCSPDGGAHCELKDLPLAMKENDFGFTWRDAYMLLPCYEAQGYDCLTTTAPSCPNQTVSNWEDKGISLSETFEIGGDVGKVYKAHLIVNGILSGKYYEGGVRDGGTDFSNLNAPAGSDSFYRGGRPVPSSYEAWQITVRHGTGEVFGHYYVNSFPQTSGLESHQTVPIGYEKDIEVPGGGTVEYRVHDSNCRAINNCGPGDGICFARNIPNEPGLTLPETWQGKPLATYNVVNGGQQPFHAQIVHLRVSKITYLKDIDPVLPEDSCAFADSDIRDAVKAALGYPGSVIPKVRAVEVTSLDLADRNIESLEGLECLTYLNTLNLRASVSGGSLDLAPLATLAHLHDLSLRSNALTDISALASLKAIEKLDLSNNQLSDLTALSDLSTLKELYLADNLISDISALSGKPALELLTLTRNSVVVLAALNSATALTNLEIFDNKVASLTPLVGLPKLAFLYATGNALNCSQQADTLDALCAQLLEHGEWHVDCGPQPSGSQSECPDY